MKILHHMTTTTTATRLSAGAVLTERGGGVVSEPKPSKNRQQMDRRLAPLGLRVKRLTEGWWEIVPVAKPGSPEAERAKKILRRNREPAGWLVNAHFNNPALGRSPDEFFGRTL